MPDKISLGALITRVFQDKIHAETRENLLPPLCAVINHLRYLVRWLNGRPRAFLRWTVPAVLPSIVVSRRSGS